MEDAAQLRKRADQAFRLGNAMTSPDDRSRILAYAGELYRAAEAAERGAGSDNPGPPAE